MRKVKIFSAILAVLTFLFLVACGGENETPDGGAGNADNSTHVHAPKVPVQENYKSATCIEGAHYDSVVYCADCGAELERNKFTVSDPLGHTPKSAVEENRVEATCTEDGSYDSVVYCKVCGDELSRTKKEILRSHKMADGKCTVCGLPESSAGLEFSLNSDGKSYTVTGIGSCKSKNVVIGTYNNLSVTTIGDYAFYYCYSLTSVTIGNSVTTIGDYAFQDCHSLTSITVDENNTAYKSIDGNLYAGDGKTLIQYAIGKTDKSFTIPDSVMSIGDYAFDGCTSLTSIVIPDSVTTIGDYAFYNCISLTSVIIPDSVTTIGSYAFDHCYRLTSVTIGNGVTTIGERAFYSCDNLTSVSIGNSVTTIGDGAFFGCTSLTSVYITDIVAWCGIEFKDSDSNPLCYANNLYLNGTLVEDLVIPDGVANIPVYAFSCKNLTSVVIPDSVMTIGSSAFRECTSLTSVTIGNSVTTIGSYAFSSCDSLTSVTIGNSVTTIGEWAFSWCQSLTSVVIPNSVTTIGGRAFHNCDSLTSVVIPDSVTTIGSYAFSFCTSLTSVVIPDSVTTIGDYAFQDCHSLKSIKYRGTKEQWNAISKGTYWDYSTGNYTVIYNYDGD